MQAEHPVAQWRDEALDIPHGKRYLRSIFFTRRITAPWAQVHLGARFIILLGLSSAALRTMQTQQLDPLGGALCFLLAFLVFTGSGTPRKLIWLYLALALSSVFSIFLSWMLFNPVQGSITYVRHQWYPGFLTLGFSLWLPLWLAVVLGFFLWRKRLLAGAVLATLGCWLASFWITFPFHSWLTIPLGSPLTLVISDQTLYTALVKVLGYVSMVLCTLSLVVSTTDREVLGLLKLLRTPQAVLFFVGIVTRSFNLALTDFQIVRQAQIARAIQARPRSTLRRVIDMAGLAVPMIALLIRRSSEIGDAYLARGYHMHIRQQEFYEAQRWRWWDTLCLLLGIGILLLAFAPHPTLTSFFF